MKRGMMRGRADQLRRPEASSAEMPPALFRVVAVFLLGSSKVDRRREAPTPRLERSFTAGRIRSNAEIRAASSRLALPTMANCSFAGTLVFFRCLKEYSGDPSSRVPPCSCPFSLSASQGVQRGTLIRPFQRSLRHGVQQTSIEGNSCALLLTRHAGERGRISASQGIFLVLGSG